MAGNFMMAAANTGGEMNLDKLYDEAVNMFGLKPEARKTMEQIKAEISDKENEREVLAGYLKELAVENYNILEAQINLLPQGESPMQAMRQVERQMFLQVIDNFWIEHLETMDYLRVGIGLRGYGQRDPLVEYKRESLRLFKELLTMIDRQVAYAIFHIGFINPSELKKEEQPKNLQLKGASDKSAFEGDQGLQERKADKIIKDTSHYNGEKVGRNDPCPCEAVYADGRPKKYKQCHGK
jgi:preprotein translocase subunit SecA